jgi:hypothetical protein
VCNILTVFLNADGCTKSLDPVTHTCNLIFGEWNIWKHLFIERGKTNFRCHCVKHDFSLTSCITTASDWPTVHRLIGIVYIMGTVTKCGKDEWSYFVHRYEMAVVAYFVMLSLIRTHLSALSIETGRDVIVARSSKLIEMWSFWRVWRKLFT